MRNRQVIQELRDKLINIYNNAYFALDQMSNLYQMENHYGISLNCVDIRRTLVRIEEWRSALTWALGDGGDFENISVDYDEIMELYEMYKVMRELENERE